MDVDVDVGVGVGVDVCVWGGGCGGGVWVWISGTPFEFQDVACVKYQEFYQKPILEPTKFSCNPLYKGADPERGS